MLLSWKTILPIFLFVLLAGIACKKDENPPPDRTFDDVEKDFKAIDIAPGIHDISLEILNGIVYNFRVIAPSLAPAEKRPLVLALHGASGGDPDAHKSTACYVEPGLAILNAFILSPNGGNDLWYDDSNQEQVATLIYLAKKYWPINFDQIAVTGYSNGGNGSWFFGETQSSTLSAAIPMASSYNTFNQNGVARKMNIPFYVIHGENDELFPLAQTQAWVEATQSVGSDITFVVAPGLGHYTPCDYTPYLQEAALWLRDTVWQ